MIPYINMLKLGKEPLNLIKYKSPYAFFCADSVVMLKNGALLTTYEVNYPDLESSSAPQIASMSALINRTVMSLAQEEGWSIHFDVKRKITRNYPAGDYDNLCGWLIDQKRAENFEKFGEHYTSAYYINFIYQLPGDIQDKTTSLFFKDNKSKKSKSITTKSLPNVQKEIDDFIDETEKIMGSLTSKIWVEHLSSSKLFSYIKSCTSLIEQDMFLPDDCFFFLDNFIFDQDVKTSIPLKVGEYYVHVMTINTFPSHTYPAIFDQLNRMQCEYRWSTRFLPLTKEESLKKAKKYQDRFFSSRKSGLTLFTEMAADVTIDKENASAVEFEAQANSIQADINMGDYLLGYYTSTLMVWDKDFEVSKIKARKIQQTVRSAGFSCIDETLNNLEAYMGMWPGNIYANIRRPIISTNNFSNIIPLSAAWQGVAWNDKFQEWVGTGLPLITCSTSYGTPFFMNLNVGDVGHTFIFGPTGAGKSTLFSLMMASALKYKDANIICIDKQLSSRAFMVASGGVYIEPGKDEVAFQPLSELLNPNEVSYEDYMESLIWCQQFIEGLLSQQNIDITPDMSKAIKVTLEQLATVPDNMKDLSSFQGYINFQNKDGINTIKIGLEPYVRSGQFGPIFDAEKTTLNLNKLMTIEMGSLMRLSEKAVAPALMYIFRYLEKIWNVKHGEKQPVTFLFLDEAWLYLQNPIFSGFLQEWLRTLRKKRVFCIFATQEVSAVANSPLKETIAQLCLTKIYLADENALVPAVKESYSYFGLTDDEIVNLSTAIMKRDYYFKNPRGCRMFQLDLDDFQLALLSTDHELLDHLEDRYGKNTGKPLAFEMLEATKQKYLETGRNPKSLDYSRYYQIVNNIA